MLVDIGLGVAAALFKVFAEGALVGPSPVSQPQLPSEPMEMRWFLSSSRMRQEASLSQWAKGCLASSLKARGSLPICHDMMAGSSVYLSPVYRLVREMISLTY